MNHNELKLAREKYGYVPAKLTAETSEKVPDIIWDNIRVSAFLPCSASDWRNPEVRKNYSSVELDEFHNSLLRSKEEDEILHGLLSVVYWGYASGTNGLFHSNLSLIRANRHPRGNKRHPPQEKREIVELLLKTQKFALENNFKDALLCAMQIKFIRMAFASKLVAFMNPTSAAVYDSVINARLAMSEDMEMQKLAVSIPATPTKNGQLKQAEAYTKWCKWCENKAEELNQKEIKWRDWNTKEYAWRAVDVERAFFALGRD